MVHAIILTGKLSKKRPAKLLKISLETVCNAMVAVKVEIENKGHIECIRVNLGDMMVY